MQQQFSRLEAILDDTTGYVGFLEGFLTDERAATIARDCEQRLQWTQETITIFAQQHLQPRLTAWIGSGLSAASRYSVAMAATPWWPLLEELRAECSALCATEFNSALANWYRHGQDGMGMHADDEPILGLQPTIASLSFGQTRKFVFKHRHGNRHEILLPHGSLLVMAGNFQHEWKHGIPKSKKTMQPRMNLTFRRLLYQPTTRE